MSGGYNPADDILDADDGNLVYAHKQNLKNKRDNDYKGLRDDIEEFCEYNYKPFRKNIGSLVFDEAHKNSFIDGTRLFNDYLERLNDFVYECGITSQSKLASSFYEEISTYLFKDIPEIKNGTYGIFNKGVYAGLKINSNNHIGIIKKDVDFCIGKKTSLSISGQPAIDLIVPIVCVEVKTFLDATMFGEVKSSSRALRSATPQFESLCPHGVQRPRRRPHHRRAAGLGAQRDVRPQGEQERGHLRRRDIRLLAGDKGRGLVRIQGRRHKQGRQITTLTPKAPPPNPLLLFS